MFLTDRDRNLIHTLTHRLKVLTVGQVHRTWWAGTRSPAVAARRLAALEAKGYLTRVTLLASPESDLPGPLGWWSPGGPEPDFASALSTARRRWPASPKVTSAVSATPLAAAALGGVARLSRPSEHTHDVHLSLVYLKFLTECPRLAKAWVGEGILVREGEGGAGVVPDALIRLPGRATAIEVVGESYTVRKLGELHGYCVGHNLSYELW